jgi:hypothetical protein
MRRPLFNPRKIHGTHICLRLSRNVRTIEKFNDFIENRTCDLAACSIVPQSTTLPSAPFNTEYLYNLFNFHWCLIDSLLVHLSDFVTCLSTRHSAFLFRFSLCSFGDLHRSWSCLYVCTKPAPVTTLGIPVAHQRKFSGPPHELTVMKVASTWS